MWWTAAGIGHPTRAEEASCSGRDEFCVVNFYHLTDVEKPHIVLALHRQWLHGEDVMGRIYISFQGINAQLSGPRGVAHSYAQWVAHQSGFEGLRWTSDPVEEHQFPRLRLQFKENLVQLAGGMRHLPITKPENRATPLEPTQWQAMLRNAALWPDARTDAVHDSSVIHESSAATRPERRPVVLDVRNGYEWDGGHFEGAARPTEEHFNQTPTDDIPQALRGCPKDTPIMMYCTGGIRCDVYSTVLREKGFNDLYTLHGGVANYMREKGASHWNGSLFTFDNRLAVAPEGSTLRGDGLAAAAPCKRCGGQAQLPHMNCANIDCNKLFLSCPACQDDLRGCCCEGCLEAPRFLRPPKTNGQYSSWHTMAGGEDLEGLKAMISNGRGEGRTVRRQKRTKRLRAKYAVIREERAERRAMVKAAMAAFEAREEDEEAERLAA